MDHLIERLLIWLCGAYALFTAAIMFDLVDAVGFFQGICDTTGLLIVVVFLIYAWRKK